MPDKTYSIRCPFHTERKATMAVNTTVGVYYCFGCHASGDVLTALQAIGKLEQGEQWSMKPEESPVSPAGSPEDGEK